MISSHSQAFSQSSNPQTSQVLHLLCIWPPFRPDWDTTEWWCLHVQPIHPTSGPIRIIREKKPMRIISGWWLTYPSEKYESQWEILFPYIMENKKTCSKPPTRYRIMRCAFWNLVIWRWYLWYLLLICSVYLEMATVCGSQHPKFSTYTHVMPWNTPVKCSPFALSSPSKFDSYVRVTLSCPCTVMGCPHLEHSGTTRIYACPFSCTKKTRVMNSNDIFNESLQGWISQTCWALFQLQMPGAKRNLIAWCTSNRLQRKNAPSASAAERRRSASCRASEWTVFLNRRLHLRRFLRLTRLTRLTLGRLIQHHSTMSYEKDCFGGNKYVLIYIYIYI